MSEIGSLLFENNSPNKHTKNEKNYFYILLNVFRLLVIMLPVFLYRKVNLNPKNKRYFSSNILFNSKEEFLLRFFSKDLNLDQNFDLICLDVENRYFNNSYITIGRKKIHWKSVFSIKDSMFFFLELLTEAWMILSYRDNKKLAFSRLLSIDTLRSYIAYVLVRELSINQKFTLYRVSENQSIDKAHVLAVAHTDIRLIYIYASLINVKDNPHLLISENWVMKSIFGVLFYSNTMKNLFKSKINTPLRLHQFKKSFYFDKKLSLKNSAKTIGVLLTILPKINSELIKTCRDLPFEYEIRHHPRLSDRNQGPIELFFLNHYVVISAVSSSIIDALLSGTFVIIKGEVPTLPDGFEEELWWDFSKIKCLKEFLNKDWSEFQRSKLSSFKKFKECF